MRNVLRGLMGRFKIVFYWMSRKEARRRVGLPELIRHCLLPRCESIAPRFAKRRGEDDRYVYYAVNGFDEPFCYPRELPYHNFAQVIAEGFLEHHWHYYAIPQTRVEKGAVVVDCGSAEGFFTFKHAGACRHVYCVEPLPLFCRALHHLFDHLENVTIIQAALSDRASTLYLSPSSIGSTCRLAADHEGDIPVAAVTLDSLFAERSIRIDYLKADLEGFEELMIAGGLETIKMSRPKIAITTYHRGQNWRALIDLVRGAVPEYRYLVKGIEEKAGNPVMLHMWCP
jgi:FkbM family methyltransferase